MEAGLEMCKDLKISLSSYIFPTALLQQGSKSFGLAGAVFLPTSIASNLLE